MRQDSATKGNMSQSIKKLFILALTLALVGLVIAWFTVFNTGHLIITTGLSDYAIYVNNELSSCLEDPCDLKLQGGSFQGIPRTCQLVML